MSEAEKFDLAVIGAGSGLVIASAAAKSGMKVAVAECGSLGGTCLNRGCIPSKMIIFPGEMAEAIRHSGNIDIAASEPKIDFSALIRRTASTVAQTRAAIESALADLPGVEWLRYPASFESNHVIRAGGRRLTAPRIVIATGAEPALPQIAGLAGLPYMTSTEALTNPVLPARLIVLGAGYIAAELGFAYSAAGSEVEFIVRSRFLKHEDDEISQRFNAIFAARHKCHTGYSVRSVSFDGKTFKLLCCHETEGSRVVSGDALLISTGIKPSTDKLALENTDIATDDKGHVIVDSKLQTGVPGVYALGDVVGNYLFRHTANHEAAYLIRLLVKGEPEKPLDYGPVPHAIFSHPEIAGVGLREQDIAHVGEELVVGRAEFADSNAGIARGYRGGFAKILARRSDGRLLGCQIMGNDAATLLHMMIPLIKSNATLDDMLDLIFIHPALPEILRDAARDALAQRERQAT
jgi:mycothione reductase